ncbi:cysteine--tRNA ligase [Candidatus Marsarchaeota archaeon]|nr:cysteine--tRNA ligase [Candidatus Marsarchaeota archaeon]
MFRPVKRRTVSMYVCGITPYDVTHLGHAFTYVFFDALSRYLEFLGFRVIYIQNITNIDDDILKRAEKEKKDWGQFGDFWTKSYLNDMKTLNVRMPAHYVKATDSIPEMIKMISALIKKGFAYKSDGNVYFNIRKFPQYGKLSGFTAKQMVLLLRERGGNPDDPFKRNNLDFILWQGKRGAEPSWDAPFGQGRPGWHIECSAMINQYLGDRIDIHGGGKDLIFPHHESEIAQSESFTGKHPFSKYFMHTAMVMFMGEKMSKSLGNLVLVSDLLKRYSPNAIRWMLLSHKYRLTWEYTADEMNDAKIRMDKIERHIKRLDAKNNDHNAINKKAMADFSLAMNDDMDIPAALRIIELLDNEGNESHTVRYMMSILGFRV